MNTNVAKTDASMDPRMSKEMNMGQKVGLLVFTVSATLLLLKAFGASDGYNLFFMLATFGVGSVGGLIYFYATYHGTPAGIRNDGIMFSSICSRGTLGWMLAVVLTTFYVLLYWHAQYLENIIRMVDPLSLAWRGKPADQWFLYGMFYTALVLIMGVRFLYKYRHSKYQILRTFSVMFFQLVAGFLIPYIMEGVANKDFYFTYFWPLKPDYIFPSGFDDLVSKGKVGYFMFYWSLAMSFIATPILTYFYGKRWYCSWVCGCGGLAETLGDPFRQQSIKKLSAWRVERWMIHSVLVVICVWTILLWIPNESGSPFLKWFHDNYWSVYGFLIVSAFAGVIGVGFYPIMGSRVWCRFGCPMAAILGLMQRFYSRFRITTNGAQCISCGNCSTYCEMGIDVRWYAQRGQNIVRASCVGCGVCSAVCPRGVLSLEGGPVGEDRTADTYSLVNEIKGRPS